jgi:isoleucyl-tRNA synthetase
MKVGNEEVLIQKEHLITETEVSDEYSYSEFKYGEVFLDITRTPALDAEGYYREVSRRIQNLRKNAGLHKVDRIRLHLRVSISLHQDMKRFEKDLEEKVGAVEIKIETSDSKENFQIHETEKIKEEEVKVSFSKV